MLNAAEPSKSMFTERLSTSSISPQLKGTLTDAYQTSSRGLYWLPGSHLCELLARVEHLQMTEPKRQSIVVT